jgi:urea carboxylase
MDHLSFRLANRIVGNAEGMAALEMTLSGPTIKFNCTTVCCLVGAEMAATLDGLPVAYGHAFGVMPGQILKCGNLSGPGLRTYLAVLGGIDVPDYLGSKSTFALGQFGGHGGRTLKTGDVLHLRPMPSGLQERSPLPESLAPKLTEAWEIGVLYGPHGAPDFFTEDDIETFFAATWQVHYNSNRTGVRLIGPKPRWARSDGGEAGLHPSNIHDNAYAIGAIDFTGDMPVILGPDGPSLGGFVCPATIVQSELWKIGQLKPGDSIRFRRLSASEAAAREAMQEEAIATLKPRSPQSRETWPISQIDDCIVAIRTESEKCPRVTYRRAGDKYLLVEYGPIVLDLELRFRVHVLMTRLDERQRDGIIDLTPGIRSLQVHYDSRILSLDALLDTLARIEDTIGDIGDIEVPSRIVHMPLSWNDAAVQKTIEKYMQSVRQDAPWCPSNIEFIRRINGLESIDEVYRIVFDANYLVLGLGDVYLGAPVATPIDPRHRLVTTKYNPARTWTPDNVVGIGGAYMCIYGMEGPGGYQLFGRTSQVWNTYRQTSAFKDGNPWLLRFFDQVKFYPVTAEELMQIRDGVIDGTSPLEITETTFSMQCYRTFLAANGEEIRAAKARQQTAFDAERARWQASDQMAASPMAESIGDEAHVVPAGASAVESSVPGCVWKIAVAEGASVSAGDVVVIVESMKMEMSILAPHDGVVTEIRCAEGKPVLLGQTLVVMMAHANVAAQ